MGRTTIRAVASALLACAALSAPASALVPITYVFEASGSGLTTGFDTASNTSYQSPFSGALFTFVVPDAASKDFFTTSLGSSVAFLSSGASGVGWTFTGPFLGLNGGGGVCFANPGGLFPTGPVSLTSGSGCGAVQYTDQGSFSKSIFTGVITKMTVLTGSASGQTAFASVTSLAAVPEPAVWTTMLIGFGGIGWMVRRRRRLAIGIA